MSTQNGDYWRNKGEQDRIHNRGYHKPHGFLSSLMTWTIAGIRKAREDNQTYHSGWSYRRTEKK